MEKEKIEEEIIKVEIKTTKERKICRWCGGRKGISSKQCANCRKKNNRGNLSRILSLKR